MYLATLKINLFMKNTEHAFHWIVDILERHGITYRISGGLAARAYGVNRELADIDIEIADADIPNIVDDVKPYIIFGPARYNDEHWDLELMTLNYEDQEIDIAGIKAKIFNSETKQWEPCSDNLESIEIKEVFGRKVPIESMDSLIAYKTKVGREVDLEDIEQLKNNLLL
ncbi:MazG-related protein [Candidatus Parcubacteria bacterium]|nr:MAG: MazG-related protein [Candidatus Parcubacteria bacterium]